MSELEVGFTAPKLVSGATSPRSTPLSTVRVVGTHLRRFRGTHRQPLFPDAVRLPQSQRRRAFAYKIHETALARIHWKSPRRACHSRARTGSTHTLPVVVMTVSPFERLAGYRLRHHPNLPDRRTRSLSKAGDRVWTCHNSSAPNPGFVFTYSLNRSFLTLGILCLVRLNRGASALHFTQRPMHSLYAASLNLYTQIPNTFAFVHLQLRILLNLPVFGFR